MFAIDLNGKGVAIIDDEDAPLVAGRRWYLHSRGYACGSRGTPLLHRHLFGCVPRDGVVVDHKNGDKLDNRRSNLRISNYSHNAANRQSVDTRNECGVPGATPRGRKWAIYIFHDGKRHYLGTRTNLLDAARRRAEGEVIYFGEVSPATRAVINKLLQKGEQSHF